MLSQTCTAKSFFRFDKRLVFLAILAWGLISFSNIPNGLGAPVDLTKARLVAENILRHHISLHGDWNGTTTPSVGAGAAVQYQGQPVAYNFSIIPSGHVLVALDDTLSPVPLYSTKSNFNADRAGHPQAIETWIVPEQHGKISNLGRRRSAGLELAILSTDDRIARAWDLYTDQSTRSTDQSTLTATALESPTLARSLTVGPLLTTAWGQSSPFNLFTPADTGCTHTLTGCVATAWAQVLNYWQWPEQGTGSHSYTWNGQTLSVDFSASTYDWDNMADTPDGLVGAENDAISKLIYDLAVAADTDFGCNDSSSEAWADDVLDIYFGYKAMTFHDRQDYDADGWFTLFQAELDADPPRPVIFSIFSEAGGHEVVVDGYDQTDSTDMVHINFGWPDSPDNYDGFYDITTDDFDAFYTWAADEQYIVTGIEPNRSTSLPSVDAGDDQTASERATVTLAGSASHDGHTIVTYQWRRVDEPQFQITGSDQASATFTAPSVSADTEMIFRLKVVDEAGNVGYDECTVTVRNIDPTPTPTPSTSTTYVSGDSGGGGGGCFIGALK